MELELRVVRRLKIYWIPQHAQTQEQCRHRYWPARSHSNCPSAVGGSALSSGNVKAEFTRRGGEVTGRQQHSSGDTYTPTPTQIYVRQTAVTMKLITTRSRAVRFKSNIERRVHTGESTVSINRRWMMSTSSHWSRGRRWNTRHTCTLKTHNRRPAYCMRRLFLFMVDFHSYIRSTCLWYGIHHSVQPLFCVDLTIGFARPSSTRAETGLKMIKGRTFAFNYEFHMIPVFSSLPSGCF